MSAKGPIDPYLKPAFPLSHRLRRAFWNAAWLVLFRTSPRPFFKWRAFLLQLFGARVGKCCFVYPSARIWAPWLLHLEDEATIGPRAEVYNPGGVSLGRRAIVSQDAFICGATHDYNEDAFPMTWRKIQIGPRAWICAQAVVLPGVTVGEGAVLGAAAVTSKDLNAWGVYAGNPARLVGDRKNHLLGGHTSE